MVIDNKCEGRWYSVLAILQHVGLANNHTTVAHTAICCAPTKLVCYLQVDGVKSKIDALATVGRQSDVPAAQIDHNCLTLQLAEHQALLHAAKEKEREAHKEVANVAARAKALDAKAARLKDTGESLAQGIAQMVVVRNLRSEALATRQQEEVQKELCQQKRKESSQLQRQVRYAFALQVAHTCMFVLISLPHWHKLACLFLAGQHSCPLVIARGLLCGVAGGVWLVCRLMR